MSKEIQNKKDDKQTQIVWVYLKFYGFKIELHNNKIRWIQTLLVYHLTHILLNNWKYFWHRKWHLITRWVKWDIKIVDEYRWNE